MLNDRLLENIQEAISKKDYHKGITELIQLRESLLSHGKKTKDTAELTNTVEQIKRIDELLIKLKSKIQSESPIQNENQFDEPIPLVSNLELNLTHRYSAYNQIIMDLLFSKADTEINSKIVLILGHKESGRSTFIHKWLLESNFDGKIVDIIQLSKMNITNEFIDIFSSKRSSRNIVVLDNFDLEHMNELSDSSVQTIAQLVEITKKNRIPLVIVTNDAKSVWERFIDAEDTFSTILFDLPNEQERRHYLQQFNLDIDYDIAVEKTRLFTPLELKEFCKAMLEDLSSFDNFPFHNTITTDTSRSILQSQVQDFEAIKRTKSIIRDPEIASLVEDIYVNQIKNSGETQIDSQILSMDPSDLGELIAIENNHEEDIVDVDHEKNIELIHNVLIEYQIAFDEISYIEGLSYTRYKVKLAKGERIQKVTKSYNEIKMRLRSKNVRIIAPIDMEDAVGIELPNDKRKILRFNQICKPYPILQIPVGQDINEQITLIDFSKDPHFLIGGSTGSGKSVNLNVFISYILQMHRPEDVQLLLIDPKRVEFSIYADLPHSLTVRPVNELEEIKNAFGFLIQTMDERYQIFEKMGIRNISEYNDKSTTKMPYIFTVVDEFATISEDDEIMLQIQRLSQLARAAGIHIILATQRPSTDIVKGTIKNNFTGRIAFKVSSTHDSKTTIYESGAEELIGKGDMLISNSGEPVNRAQGAFIGLDEIKKIIRNSQNKYGLNPQIKKTFREST